MHVDIHKAGADPPTFCIHNPRLFWNPRLRLTHICDFVIAADNHSVGDQSVGQDRRSTREAKTAGQSVFLRVIIGREHVFWMILAMLG